MFYTALEAFLDHPYLSGLLMNMIQVETQHKA